MCSLETEGTQHGCGHYIISRKLDKRDCMNNFCINSSMHAPSCPHCPNCKRYFDPDHKENVVAQTTKFCQHCQYWFDGPGKQQRRG